MRERRPMRRTKARIWCQNRGSCAAGPQTAKPKRSPAGCSLTIRTRKEILFIQTGNIGGITIHYFLPAEKISKKFIQLKRLTGEFNYVEHIGLDTLSIYIPILELEEVNLRFPKF